MSALDEQGRHRPPGVRSPTPVSALRAPGAAASPRPRGTGARRGRSASRPSPAAPKGARSPRPLPAAGRIRPETASGIGAASARRRGSGGGRTPAKVWVGERSVLRTPRCPLSAHRPGSGLGWPVADRVRQGRAPGRARDPGAAAPGRAPAPSVPEKARGRDLAPLCGACRLLRARCLHRRATGPDGGRGVERDRQGEQFSPPGVILTDGIHPRGGGPRPGVEGAGGCGSKPGPGARLRSVPRTCPRTASASASTSERCRLGAGAARGARLPWWHSRRARRVSARRDEKGASESTPVQMRRIGAIARSRRRGLRTTVGPVPRPRRVRAGACASAGSARRATAALSSWPAPPRRPRHRCGRAGAGRPPPVGGHGVSRGAALSDAKSPKLSWVPWGASRRRLWRGRRTTRSTSTLL